MQPNKSKFGWFRNNISLYLMLLIPVAYILIFHYYPMYGAQIAFRDYRISRGILNSEWVGMKHFVKFFTRNYKVWRIIGNTLGINLYQLAAGFPLPIVFALLLNYLPGKNWRKAVQTVTYAPYFISVVVIAGMLLQFCSTKNGLFNNIIAALGGTRTDIIGNPKNFWSLYVWSGIWQSLGYGSVIYFSALQSVDLPKVQLPLIRSIPFLGEVLSGHSVLTYLAVLVVILVAVLLYKTKLGTYIRAVGESPQAIETAGFPARRIRFLALLISGAIAGMGGAFMSMAYVSGFTKDMVSGRGFIALAAEAMGRGRPLMSSLAALLFGFTDSLANNLQVLGLSSDLARMFPYVITIIALSIYAGRSSRGRKMKRRR